MVDETEDPRFPDAADGASAPSESAARPRRRRFLRIVAVAAAVAVATMSLAAFWLYHHLNSNIRTDTAAEKALASQAGLRPQRAPGDAQNVLIMGSDYRPELGSGRSDTVLFVHLSGDGKRLQVVSVPRDLMVDIPACTTPEGGTTQAQFAQFNWSFAYGGAACTIRTFEQLTGIRVDHHIVLGFDGFAKIIDTIGGVAVDLPQAERDPNVGLDLAAGPHLLDGTEALAYVRAREYIGNGSDINRIGRQQQFLRLVSSKLQSTGVLLDPVRLYRVLDSATSAVTTDPGLDSLGKLYGLVAKIRNIPAAQVDYRTVPWQTYPPDPNRVEVTEPDADQLFAALRADHPYSPGVTGS
jgi:LCP family protein required for cell wall assembly